MPCRAAVLSAAKELTVVNEGIAFVEKINADATIKRRRPTVLAKISLRVEREFYSKCCLPKLLVINLDSTGRGNC